jgi:dTDP-4-amino-4,6-dideoxygalactose transaminase
MFYQLPPVGNPLRLRGANSPLPTPDSLFSPYQPCFYASGTTALAAAIIAAARIRQTSQPEVILPAYGCPDLVSAAVYAGVKPVLVDLEPGQPWMDLAQLQTALNPRTVAVVAVDLFGIAERLAQLRAITEQAGILLIEDSAQAFPGGREPVSWQGDLVVLSFGRGKPVSLLGGGAVLLRESSVSEHLPRCDQQSSGGRRALFALKAALYNRMISPRLYWLPQALPFLHLGETRYHPLVGIACMDAQRLALLPANVADYRSDAMQAQAALTGMLAQLDPAVSGITDLPRVCGVTPERRLLRYPLLVDTNRRNRLYDALHKHGLGPSLMYPAALPNIDGLESILAEQGPFPAAESFAAGILTLPVHRRVSTRDIDCMRQVILSSTH